MKKIVITRIIDDRSRVQIPNEVLKASNLEKGDAVSFEISRTGSLVIRKVKEDDN